LCSVVAGIPEAAAEGVHKLLLKGKTLGYVQHTATHYNTLQHSTTHYNTLQHTATHCNTLQHTATHCKALLLNKSL